MLANLATSGIRTLSAYAVAWLLSLKLAGPVLDLFGVGTDTAKERLTALFVFVLGTAYYFVVRLLEHKWPAVGVALGAPTKPSYAPVTADGAHVVTSLPAAVVDANTGALLAVPVDDKATADTLASWDAIHPSDQPTA